jgi:dynein heavy chain
MHFLFYWHVQLCGFAVSLAGLYLYKQFKSEAPAPKAENILPLSSSDARIEWEKLNNNINTNAQTYKKSEDGCFIYGLFLEGARWNKKQQTLVDPKPKELFSPMPMIHMLSEQNRSTPQSNIYRCPVYKVLTRTGTLSTTGHSTNFVTWIEVPSNKKTIFRSSLVSETNAQIKF